MVYEKETDTHHMFVRYVHDSICDLALFFAHIHRSKHTQLTSTYPCSEIGPHCGMAVWVTNTQVVHAVSKTGPAGPFLRQNIILPAQADNPQVIRDPLSSKWLLFHHGTHQGSMNMSGPCYANGTTMPNASQATGYRPDALPPGFTPGALLHVADKPEGPWKAVVVNATGQRGDPLLRQLGSCGNPR